MDNSSNVLFLPVACGMTGVRGLMKDYTAKSPPIDNCQSGRRGLAGLNLGGVPFYASAFAHFSGYFAHFSGYFGVFMNNKSNSTFWLGNGILLLALVMLWNMGVLWEHLGAAAMVLWVAVAGYGAYLLMSGDRE
jgi:hypothetical protein